MNAICVFCGSSFGARPIYADAAREAAATIARRGMRLVYGGGRVGLMGIVADTALSMGGEVVGIMPQHLVDREIAHKSLTQFHVTSSMHERKRLMAELSDGFLVLPGGFGTLEELAEVLSWAQIGLHAKPVGLLDVDGFYASLFKLFDTMVEQGFLREASRNLVLSDCKTDRLIDAMVKRA